MSDHLTLSETIRSTSEGDRVWQQERAILEATERLCELMERDNVTRSDLAYRLGKSRGFVSQILNGEANMTLRTLSDAFFALGRAVHITDGALAAGHDTPGLMQICSTTVDWSRGTKSASSSVIKEEIKWDKVIPVRINPVKLPPYGKEKDHEKASA